MSYSKLAWRGIQAISVVYIFHEYFFDFVESRGPSMLPTINNEILLVDKFSYSFLGAPKKSDVVIAKAQSGNTSITVCKRIIAQGGDDVYVQSYDSMLKKVTVPQGLLFLHGDNPSRSRDSREYGPVPEDTVMGRVVYKLWPPSRFGPINKMIPEVVEKCTLRPPPPADPLISKILQDSIDGNNADSNLDGEFPGEGQHWEKEPNSSTKRTKKVLINGAEGFNVMNGKWGGPIKFPAEISHELLLEQGYL